MKPWQYGLQQRKMKSILHLHLKYIFLLVFDPTFAAILYSHVIAEYFGQRLSYYREISVLLTIEEQNILGAPLTDHSVIN